LLLRQGKQQNDLSNRIKIKSNRNNDGWTSVLIISNMTIWDEGYYTCRSTDLNQRVSSRVYIFPFGLYYSYQYAWKYIKEMIYWSNIGLRRSTRRSNESPRNLLSIRDIDPLRSFYVVQEPSSPINEASSATRQTSIIIPCLVRSLSISGPIEIDGSIIYRQRQVALPLQRKNAAGRNWQEVYYQFRR